MERVGQGLYTSCALNSTRYVTIEISQNENQEVKSLKVCGKNALLLLILRIKRSRNSNIVLLKRCTFHSKFYLKQDKNCLSVIVMHGNPQDFSGGGHNSMH